MVFKRRLPALIAGVVLLFLTYSLWSGHGGGSFQLFGGNHYGGAGNSGPVLKSPYASKLPANNRMLTGNVPTYVKTILDPEDQTFDRLQCTRPNVARYGSLAQSAPQKQYFFALLMHKNVDIMPRLLGSLVEVIKFLGPRNCAFSVVEGRSDDGTYETLVGLQEPLAELGVSFFLQKSELDTSVDRIPTLAKLRNLALDPLLMPENAEHFSESTTVVFMNDVSACPDDILELIYQKKYQQADMTCAMDWSHPNNDPPLFYDIWIARGMTGDTFFQISPNGAWEHAHNLFWNDEKSLTRFNADKPFQVFACWNGGVAFTAAPLLQGKLTFRANQGGECFQGEPSLFCKDMWRHGYGKIAVIPSVNLEYSDEMGKRTKQEKGYVADLVRNENNGGSSRIDWVKDPPEKVKCMPDFAQQSWKVWNDGFQDGQM